jgi:hypothetical protein
MKCQCGFEFKARPGEFKDFDIGITKDGDWVMVCPQCKAAYRKIEKRIL